MHKLHDKRHEEYQDGYRQRHHPPVIGDQEVDLARRAVGVVVLACLAFEPGDRAQGQLGPQGPFARSCFRQDTAEDLEQNGVIHRREVLHDVGAQHVPIASGEGLQPIDGPMRPLAGTIGVALGNLADRCRRAAARGDRAGAPPPDIRSARRPPEPALTRRLALRGAALFSGQGSEMGDTHHPKTDAVVRDVRAAPEAVG